MLRQTKDLYAEGIGHKELAGLLDAGALLRLRHGVYADPDRHLTVLQQHRRLIEGTVPLLADNKVVSHLSAAVLHGLPVADVPHRVMVTRDGVAGGRRGSQLHLRVTPLPDSDVIRIDGIPVTSLGRTMADLARVLPLVRSLPLADAALRTGLERTELAERLEASVRRPGVGRFRAMAHLADAGAESPGESLSRLLLRQLGLPTPRLQYEIFDSVTGELLARVDFCWPELRIVGEFDGQVKYTGGAEALTATVMREKRREQRLRADGWSVIRWVWAELDQPELILAQWRTAVAARAA